MQLEDLLNIIDRPSAWRWICRQYFPDGVKCPRCGAPITGKRALETFETGGEKVFCSACGRSFRTRAVTPMAGTEWEPEEFVKLLLMDHFGMSPAPIAPLLGKSARCVRDMLERIHLHDEEFPF